MLTLTFYVDEEGEQRFEAHLAQDEDTVVNVTEDYEAFTAQLDDGRTGIIVAKKVEDEQ